MGYEINYSEAHYAEAKAICTATAGEMQVVMHSMRAEAGNVEQNRQNIQFFCAGQGVPARAPHLTALANQLRLVAMLAEAAQHQGEELADKLQRAIDNAARTERRMQTMIALLLAPKTLWDGYWESKENQWRPPRENTESLVQLLSILLNGGQLPLKNFDPEGSPVDEVSKNLAKLLDGQNLLHQLPVRIESQEQLETMEFDGGLNSYYQLQREVGQQDSRILVGEVEQNGEEVYLVILPGTHGDFGDQNPFNPRGIIDSLGHDSDNYAQAIIEALEFSGAKEGAKIIFTGHSQGGIHAVNLSKNKLLRQKFKPQGVLTLGSPIGNIQIPQDVFSLHVEDATDPVPGMDGQPNEGKKDQITVTFPHPQNIEDLSPGGFGFGHRLENYGEHLKQVEDQPKPELGLILDGLRFSPGPIKLNSFELRRDEKKQRKQWSDEEQQQYRRWGKVAPPH